MDFMKYPRQGKFAKYGGQFIPETLMFAVNELEKAYKESQTDTSFQAQLQEYLKEYARRPTPLYYAEKRIGCVIIESVQRRRWTEFYEHVFS